MSLISASAAANCGGLTRKLARKRRQSENVSIDWLRVVPPSYATKVLFFLRVGAAQSAIELVRFLLLFSMKSRKWFARVVPDTFVTHAALLLEFSPDVVILFG